ncbi:MAG: tetratricopeptide repeat protein [Paracoccaceae bacterium]
MSDTDGFIEEVTEEVRRDKLYGHLRRYGWIGVLFIVLVVGGTAWQTWRSGQEREQAQALGDAMLNALEQQNASERIESLTSIESSSSTATALRDFLLAAAQMDEGNIESGRQTLKVIEDNADLPMVYRQIASFKSLSGAGDTVPADERRAGFEALAQPGGALRLLAEEQIVLIEIETGETDAAIERLQRLLEDAEATPDLQQRAVQVIVALGGEPDLAFGASAEN